MKTTLKLICLLFCCNIVLGQNNLAIKKQVDSIRYLKGDAAFDCNSVIWRIIARKKEAVPYLITLISDNTPIPVYYRCKRGNMKVGDMAFYVLDEIVSVPKYLVTGEQFDVYYGGCQSGVYDYIDENRLRFQRQVREWYLRYEKEFVRDKFIGGPTGCRLKNKIDGYYRMRFEDEKSQTGKLTKKAK